MTNYLNGIVWVKDYGQFGGHCFLGMFTGPFYYWGWRPKHSHSWCEMSFCLWRTLGLCDVCISSSTMWPCKKIFLTSKFSYLLFSNPTLEVKTGTAKRWETTNNNPPEPIKLSNQPTAGARLCCAFYQPQNPVQSCWAKTICWAASAFLNPNFFCRARY